MSRVRTVNSHTQKPQQKKPQVMRPRVVGRDSRTQWRCSECTFLNDSEQATCKTCGAEKKPMGAPQHRPSKPCKSVKSTQKEEKKTTNTYYDRTDRSENVPIAGIKKYHYDPKRLPRHLPDKSSSKNSNIATIKSLEKKPEQFNRMENGRRDIVGALQDAASDKPLPCMRKSKK